MGDDANRVRLTHINDPEISKPWSAAATAYYNCVRHVQRQRSGTAADSDRARQK